MLTLREEYEKLLTEISQSCFDEEVFKGSQTKRIISHIKEKYGDELEFLWKSSPNNAIARNKASGKWYAVVMTIPENKLGLASCLPVEIMNLHLDKKHVLDLTNKISYFPAWHMNKQSWISIILNDSLDDIEIFDRIDESYNLSM